MTKRQEEAFDEALRAFDEGLDRLDKVLDILLTVPADDEPDFDYELDALH